MIDFIVSVEEHKEVYDSRQAWKIRYLLFAILFLCFACKWQGLIRGKRWTNLVR